MEGWKGLLLLGLLVITAADASITGIERMLSVRTLFQLKLCPKFHHARCACRVCRGDRQMIEGALHE